MAVGVDDRLFRLNGAVRHNPAIDAWLASQPGELGALAGEWFGRFRGCGEDVEEVMHDGAATACVQGAAFGYVAVFTAHVNVGLYHGADLPDPLGLLEGRGRRMRHVKLRSAARVDAGALEALIRAAYAHISMALPPPPTSREATPQL